MVVPTTRLYLDVLTNHVEAHLLCCLNIVEQSRISRSSIDSIGPETLIEGTYMEDRFIVEEHSCKASILCKRYFTHSEVTLHAVECIAIADYRDIEVVEERRIGRPQFCIGNRYNCLFALNSGN